MMEIMRMKKMMMVVSEFASLVDDGSTMYKTETMLWQWNNTVI